MSVLSEPRSAPSRLSAITWRPSWHWVHVVVAALAMVATLPGRTHGLGLITEPLLTDLRLDRLNFATINLWATLLGALFCVPCGWLLDRLGTRAILVSVTVSLGLVVLLMSRTRGDGLWELFVLVLLTRGLGQSALSVASLALIGKTAGRRPGPAVGVYSFVTAVGFMLAFGAVKYSIDRWDLGWRTLWADIGGALLVFAVLAGLLVRPALVEGSPSAAVEAGKPRPGQTLGQALRTPVF